MASDVNSKPTATIILPHREHFAAESAGAVAMVVRGLALGPSRYQPTVIGPPVSSSFPGIPFRPAHAPRWLPLSGSQRYIVAVAGHLARMPPGLIEVHNKPEIALWLSRRFPRRPVTLVLHNDPRTMRGAKSPAARQRLRHRLAAIITVSDFVRRGFLEGLNDPSGCPLQVIHNAIDPASLPPPPAVRDKLILFAGRVVPDKAPDAFVAACARALPHLPGWRAEIIGTDGFSADIGDSSFIRRLRPQAAAANVTMRGYQPHPHVLEALSRAAIAVVPSRWDEPFGLAALEALASGTALICSMRGGLAEVAGDAALPIDPENAEGFAQALIALAQDEKLREKLTMKGRQRVAAEFKINTAIEAFDDVRDKASEKQAVLF
jgi:glycosyltransferase involved in cell wall biosynthesis